MSREQDVGLGLAEQYKRNFVWDLLGDLRDLNDYQKSRFEGKELGEYSYGDLLEHTRYVQQKVQQFNTQFTEAQRRQAFDTLSAKIENLSEKATAQNDRGTDHFGFLEPDTYARLPSRVFFEVAAQTPGGQKGARTHEGSLTLVLGKDEATFQLTLKIVGIDMGTSKKLIERLAHDTGLPYYVRDIQKDLY